MRKTQSYRNLRVASSIKAALDEIFILGKGISPKLYSAGCSITNLLMSPDLKLATCYFVPSVTSVLSAEELINELNLAKFAIRKLLANKVHLKYTPEIRFIYDKGFANAVDVNKMLSIIDKEALQG